MIDSSIRQGRKHISLRVFHSCAELCGRTRDNPAGDRKARAAARCSLPDFDPAAWDPDADPEVAAEAESLAAMIHTHDIGFELDTHGCPWGWRLSGFATSVERYIGKRSVDSPIRGQNLLLMRRMLRDEEVPERLVEMVTLAEAYEDGVYAKYNGIRSQQG